jgi:hypothetical protein
MILDEKRLQEIERALRDNTCSLNDKYALVAEVRKLRAALSEEAVEQHIRGLSFTDPNMLTYVAGNIRHFADKCRAAPSPSFMDEVREHRQQYPHGCPHPECDVCAFHAPQAHGRMRRVVSPAALPDGRRRVDDVRARAHLSDPTGITDIERDLLADRAWDAAEITRLGREEDAADRYHGMTVRAIGDRLGISPTIYNSPDEFLEAVSAVVRSRDEWRRTATMMRDRAESAEAKLERITAVADEIAGDTKEST